jgi:DNA-binding response OmpR family regulator
MKILLVDDEEGFLLAMGTVLREQGYEVTLAADGKQAREALDGMKFDLIISDVFMPTLDGVRFHSYVREFTDAKEVPFIFISGYDDQHTRGLAQNSPRDFFLSKTTPVEEVIALVEKLKNTPPSGPV